MSRRDPGEALVRAAARILRPLMRQLVASGVPFGRLEARLREEFVRVAEDEFAVPGKRQTDSRISLLTGINRKEIRRIRSEAPEASAPSTFSRNQAADLVSRWLLSSKATDRHGRPKVLPYQADTGPSFVRFAQETTRDVSPRAILEELLRTGTVELRSRNRVALRAEAFVPLEGSEEKLRMLGQDPPELIETILYNVAEAGDNPWLQRKVAYDNLGAEGMQRLRQVLRREGERFIRKADRLVARHDRDRNANAPGGERRYAGIGVYYFEAPVKTEETKPSAGGKPAGTTKRGKRRWRGST